ncbi:hypothetical protein CXG81DRAFT_6295, partial [Caulochytrium protostelioides]
LTTSVLVERLKTLQSQLMALEQDSVEVASLKRVSRELIDERLLLHRDKAIKILTACCLAECLRLYAPEAPYTDHELTDVFDLFVRQLRYVGEVQHPLYSYYFMLLESLSTVKSILLVTDLPDADELMTNLFKHFFDAATPDLPHRVRECMLDILVQIVDEAHLLPAEQAEVAQRARARHQLVTDLIQHTSDKLQKYVCQYFSEALLRGERHPLADEQERERAHRLVVDIAAARCESVLLNVIPLVQEELRHENSRTRALAIRTLGRCWRAHPGMTTAFASAWKAWCERRIDRDLDCRLPWVE